MGGILLKIDLPFPVMISRNNITIFFLQCKCNKKDNSIAPQLWVIGFKTAFFVFFLIVIIRFSYITTIFVANILPKI